MYGVLIWEMKLLKVSRLCAGYKDLQVLIGVSLEVRAGEFLAVIGSNAAGKTTLMRAMVGQIRPYEGEVEFLGQRVNGLPPHALAQRGLCLVPERGVFPRLSVKDNLMLGAYRKDARSVARDTLDQVFALFPVLAERYKQAAGSLSGGEQQMLCIGRALMAKPKLLLLDEPSEGLSPLMVSNILHSLKELNRLGLTILLVEQNVAQTLRIIDRAYVLENGRIVLEGPASELAGNSTVQRAYLGL